MHGLQTKLAVTVSSSHALWSWCMRHAAWILNRYNLHQGLTAYEVVYGKPYSGQICEYGEPVLGFAKSLMKGNPRWHRMLFLGKVDGQDSFLLFNGTALILTRSVRRVKPIGFLTWRSIWSSIYIHGSTRMNLVEEFSLQSQG